MGSISATECMKVKVQSAMQNGHVEDKMGTGGGAAFYVDYIFIFINWNGNYCLN